MVVGVIREVAEKAEAAKAVAEKVTEKVVALVV